MSTHADDVQTGRSSTAAHVDAKRERYKRVSEADYLTQIIDTLHLHGWVVAHFRTAMTQGGRYMTPVQADGAGFPDIVALHPKTGDMLVVELKRENGRATAEQLQWLTFFELADVDAYLWKPSDIDKAIERIAEPRRRLRKQWEERQ